MDISFVCTVCGKRQEVSEEKAGRLVVCRKCQSLVPVRRPEPARIFHRHSPEPPPPEE